MRAHAKFLLDQLGHARTGPERGFIPQRLGSAEQQLLQTLAVFRTQTRLVPRASGFQAGFALRATLLHPTRYRLVNDFQLTGNRGLAFSPFPQADSFVAAFLQLVKIATYSSRVSHTGLAATTLERVALLCGIQ